MEKYSISLLKRGSGEILNELHDGPVIITHSHRKDMVLVMRDHYEHLQEQANKVVNRGGRGSAKIVPELRAEFNGG
jgi:PHD/YefM family antitoxin component YafN of YafNO toxin-antitoxin module